MIDPVSDDALRFADGIAVALDGDRVLVENGATGAGRGFDRAVIPLLDLFVNWAEPHAVIDWAMANGGTAEVIDAAFGVLLGLLEIDALIGRKAELSGDRLPPPGSGWDDAMRFLAATRTTGETIFAAPAEFNAALAEKAFFTRQASAFREYPDAAFTPLSAPDTAPTPDARGFSDAMLGRRTARRYAAEPISAQHLSNLLYYGWGMTKSVPNPLGDVFVRKTSPSGGSLHAVEVYPIVFGVDGVAPGLYHYSVRRHGLERLGDAVAADWIVRACGDQAWVAEAGVVFLCTAFLPRTAWKYGFSRVARAVMAEIGMTGQSMLLAASWQGLGGFTTIALRDEMFERLIGLDPAREPVFAIFGAGRLEGEIADHARPRAEGPVEGEGAVEGQDESGADTAAPGAGG